MTTSEKTTLKQLVTRLHEQSLEMATLRAALDVQFTRIAQMQAELDLLPHARKRRQTLRVLLAEPPRHKSWDGPERRRGQSTEELRAHLRELRVAWETGPKESNPITDRVPARTTPDSGALSRARIAGGAAQPAPVQAGRG